MGGVAREGGRLAVLPSAQADHPALVGVFQPGERTGKAGAEDAVHLAAREGGAHRAVAVVADDIYIGALRFGREAGEKFGLLLGQPVALVGIADEDGDFRIVHGILESLVLGGVGRLVEEDIEADGLRAGGIRLAQDAGKQFAVDGMAVGQGGQRVLGDGDEADARIERDLRRGERDPEIEQPVFQHCGQRYRTRGPRRRHADQRRQEDKADDGADTAHGQFSAPPSTNAP